MINNLVHVELAYINTNHPDFIGGSKAVSSLMDRMAAMQHQNNSKPSKAQQKVVWLSSLLRRWPLTCDLPVGLRCVVV